MSAIAGGLILAAGATAASVAMRPDSPDSPDYKAATREGYEADLETLPLRKKYEAAAKLGKSVLKDGYTSKEETAADGTKKTVYLDAAGKPVEAKDAVLADFAGYSDIDLSRANLDFQLESADKTAGAALDIQKKYGPEYIAQRLKELELSDPIGTELRKKYGESVLGDLQQGYSLPAGLEEEVTQSERAAQAARGNIYGAAPAAAEALKVGDAAQRLYQQRLANVSSFLSGTTPSAQFSSISGAQQGAAPYAAQNIQGGLGLNQNAGAQAAQFAQQSYSQQSSNALNSGNPWGSLLGAIGGLGLGAASSGIAGMGSNYKGSGYSMSEYNRIHNAFV